MLFNGAKGQLWDKYAGTGESCVTGLDCTRPQKHAANGFLGKRMKRPLWSARKLAARARQAARSRCGPSPMGKVLITDGAVPGDQGAHGRFGCAGDL